MRYGVSNTTRVLVAAVIGLAFSSVSFGQEKPTAPTKETASTRSQATVLTGQVTRVDAKAGKLSVKTKDKEISLTTDSQSTKTALAKLKVGDIARVFERGGTLIAVSPAGAESTKAPK
jgi:Cu/Ag efflux protein CusF